MKLKVMNLIALSILLLIGMCSRALGQTNKVSPKLDFDDTENKENSSVPVVPGVVQGRADGGGSGIATGGGGGGSSSTSGTASSSKTGPKIHGVRVTVDTGDNHKSKESKESVEITEGGKHTKRVGIHTDITFEITADGNDGDGNGTNTAQRSEEDASVPIYKGRGGSTNKSRKPYDPKTHWNPNYSSERGGYDSSGRAGYQPFGSGQYPQNVPIYTGTGESRGSGSIYRKGDGWNSYVPMTNSWTTERYHSDSYRPNTLNGYRVPSWKPCYCISSGIDSRRRRDNNNEPSVLKPTSSVIEVVDGKLERPFS